MFQSHLSFTANNYPTAVCCGLGLLKGGVAFKGNGRMLRALWRRELNKLSEEKLLLPSGDYPCTSLERKVSVLVKATAVSLDHLTNTSVFPVHEEGILQFL